MAITLYCTQCGRGETIQGLGEVPDCRVCGPTTWKSASDPRVDYALTHMDKRFLKSIRVEAE